ncbi:metallophosphoesterase domain-containing protein 1-like [Uranotaenia lowii]|uniref:metallophosphoesterase domain-containing protein 1-like n=1 Tax=Uranotaenia lowii TaxID=190385 RepID=UPI002478E3B3|nr:metallophosphoesterase domain-containing protein 1-like [Uranotaenia lowii]
MNLASIAQPLQYGTGGCCKNTGSTIVDEIPTLGHSKESLAEVVKKENIHQYLSNCTYLQNKYIELYGLKINGTPWQPEFCKWAFNVKGGKDCLEKWENIPENIDILITQTLVMEIFSVQEYDPAV